jgi:two-component system NtrC family response regulator
MAKQVACEAADAPEVQVNGRASQKEALRHLLAHGEVGELAPPVAEAAVRFCEELVRTGDSRAALELADQLSPHRGELSPEVDLRLHVARVTALVIAGRYIEALELVRRVFSESQPVLPTCPNLSGRLTVLEGMCLWMLNQAEESLHTLIQLRTQLLQAPDSPLLAFCTNQLSAVYGFIGKPELAVQMALDAVVSARRTGDKYVVGQTLTNYSQVQKRACRWAEAKTAGEEALAIHKEIGARHQVNHVLRSLTLLRWKRGELELALKMSEQCAAGAKALGNAVLGAFTDLTRALILIHVGRYDEATKICTSVPGWEVLHGGSKAVLLAAEYVGDIQLERGQAEAACATFDELHTKTMAVAPTSEIVAELQRRLAECHYMLGRHETAFTLASSGLAQCRALGDRYEEAATYRILALSAAAIGKPDEAKKWFDEGFAFYEDIQTPYEWGKLWMAYGDWLLGPHAGTYADRRGAHEAYLAAQDHFERIGAKAKLAEANERLARLAPASPSGTGLVKDEVRRTPRSPRRALDLERRSAWAFETFGLVTRSPSMLSLLDDVATLAKSDTPMLVLGESGTGKELVARGIHALSGRKGTFMAINAGSLPREIIESELFGHVVGSFTGATRDKAGIFEVCNKGTVFLDEIAEMSTELQSRLLRFLETGESRRVGANGNIAVDTRIIAATNRDRRDLERGKDFRVDLYYRLAHAVTTLPPLRQRGDDVRLLVEHFLAEACAAAGRQVELSPATMQSLIDYPWPGNVRQLRAVIKRVVLLAKHDRVVTPEQLELHNAEVPTTLNGELEVEERRIVQEALVKASGSRTEAAKILGVPRTTLVNKIRRFGL